MHDLKGSKDKSKSEKKASTETILKLILKLTKKKVDFLHIFWVNVSALSSPAHMQVSFVLIVIVRYVS